MVINLAGKFGGKSWQRIGRKLAGKFSEELAENWREILKFGGKIWRRISKKFGGKF